MKNKKISENCRFCFSKNIVKRGLRYNENNNSRQLFLCKSCAKKFSIDDGLLKYRHTKKEIDIAVNLYSRHSSSEVQEILKRKKINVSRWTIIKWSKKFSTR